MMPGINRKKPKSDKLNWHKLKILKSDKIDSKSPLSEAEYRRQDQETSCIQNVSTPAYFFKSSPNTCEFLGPRGIVKKIIGRASSSMAVVKKERLTTLSSYWFFVPLTTNFSGY